MHKTLSLAMTVLTALFGVPASAQQMAVGPVPNPQVIMLRVFVSDVPRSEKFYNQVFGAVVAERIGDFVRYMNFPGGKPPGLIVQKTDDKSKMDASFVLQVPDLEAVLTRATANGGTVQPTPYAQDVQGMAARSRHVLDPDGNDIEVLQIGKAPAAK